MLSRQLNGVQSNLYITTKIATFFVAPCLKYFQENWYEGYSSICTFQLLINGCFYVRVIARQWHLKVYKVFVSIWSHDTAPCGTPATFWCCLDYSHFLFVMILLHRPNFFLGCWHRESVHHAISPLCSTIQLALWINVNLINHYYSLKVIFL